MPTYQYKCDECKQEQEEVHEMTFDPDIICICGYRMHRVPQLVGVNWGQLKPSNGELSPQIRDLINNADRRREEYLEAKPEHERNQALGEKALHL